MRIMDPSIGHRTKAGNGLSLEANFLNLGPS